MSSPSSVSFKDPKTLFSQSNAVKRSVIASYWTVIVLALPLWWYATSIQRLSLPTSQIHSHAERRLKIPVDICVEDASIIADLQNSFDGKLMVHPGLWEDLKIVVYGGSGCR